MRAAMVRAGNRTRLPPDCTISVSVKDTYREKERRKMNKNNNRDKLPLTCKLIVPENTKNRGDMFVRFSSLKF